MNCNRRDFIKSASAAAITIACPRAVKAAVSRFPQTSPVEIKEKRLSFYNIHTRENLSSCYFKDGEYQTDELKKVNNILRDRRTGEVHPIDLRLLDILYEIKGITDDRHPFHVISGYRSPSTNAMLYRTTTGVDKNSYHMKGRAIDIRLPGMKTARLREMCIQLEKGGVGYYPKSNFVHVDTGPVRIW